MRCVNHWTMQWQRFRSSRRRCAGKQTDLDPLGIRHCIDMVVVMPERLLHLCLKLQLHLKRAQELQLQVLHAPWVADMVLRMSAALWRASNVFATSSATT